MGAVERAIKDRAADSLAEIPRLDVRAMFSGFGFYLDEMLVAAAWDGAFRLRQRRDGHWTYQAVDDALVDRPEDLVPLVLANAEELSREPAARRRR